ELEFIKLIESLRACEIGWLTFFFELDVFAERVFQSALDQIDREIGDINTDPLSAKFLRSVNGCAASAKRIEHHIAGLARSLEHSLDNPDWLLCLISELLLFGIQPFDVLID